MVITFLNSLLIKITNIWNSFDLKMGFFNSLLDKIKNIWNSFDLKKISQNIEGTSAEAIQALVFFVSSFFVGLIFKKYFKFLFSCLICSFILIKFFEYNQLLIIDWSAIKVFLGFEANTSINTFITSSFDWIKHNIISSIAVLIGFIIGYKLG